MVAVCKLFSHKYVSSQLHNEKSLQKLYEGISLIDDFIICQKYILNILSMAACMMGRVTEFKFTSHMICLAMWRVVEEKYNYLVLNSQSPK